MNTQITGLCFVISAKTGLILLQYKRPECHVSMTRRSSDGSESNFLQCLDEQVFFVGRVEAYRFIRRCCVSNGGRPGDLILAVLMRWSHAGIYLSYWTHMVQLICVCLREDLNCGGC